MAKILDTMGVKTAVHEAVDGLKQQAWVCNSVRAVALIDNPDDNVTAHVAPMSSWRSVIEDDNQLAVIAERYCPVTSP